MKPTPYSGADRQHDGAWNADAETQLRTVCREQREEIARLKARIEDLEVQLGQRARVRSMMSRGA